MRPLRAWVMTLSFAVSSETGFIASVAVQAAHAVNGNGDAAQKNTRAEELATLMLEHGESFWSAVFPIFMSRDLTRTDLGAHLQKIIASGRKLGPRVVFHLHGSGDRPTTPVRLKGSSLVLYFEPPEKKPTGAPPAPLVLVPPSGAAQAAEALFEVEDGDLVSPGQPLVRLHPAGGTQ